MNLLTYSYWIINVNIVIVFLDFLKYEFLNLRSLWFLQQNSTITSIVFCHHYIHVNNTQKMHIFFKKSLYEVVKLSFETQAFVLDKNIQLVAKIP